RRPQPGSCARASVRRTGLEPAPPDTPAAPGQRAGRRPGPMKQRSTLFLIAVACLALGFPARGATAPNLILISMDTTRAGPLGDGGHPLQPTPVLARLSRSAHLFAAAQSVIPLTGPAHGAILTGLYPHAHGGLRNTTPIRSDVPTLAEVLHADGYQTA